MVSAWEVLDGLSGRRPRQCCGACLGGPGAKPDRGSHSSKRGAARIRHYSWRTCLIILDHHADRRCQDLRVERQWLMPFLEYAGPYGTGIFQAGTRWWRRGPEAVRKLVLEETGGAGWVAG